MATERGNWARLREWRKRLGLTQSDMAEAMGLKHQAVHRRELPPTHPEHVGLSDGELLVWIGAAKQLIEKRTKEVTPAEVLSE